jgi:NAD(P)-dependent dehydrogenase (short-subunit alcohol dehydrogenase family)
MSLAGLVVLITGAASGIGAATASELHRRGAKPVLVDCDDIPLREVSARCGNALACVATVITELAPSVLLTMSSTTPLFGPARMWIL